MDADKRNSTPAFSYAVGASIETTQRLRNADNTAKWITPEWRALNLEHHLLGHSGNDLAVGVIESQAKAARVIGAVRGLADDSDGHPLLAGQEEPAEAHRTRIGKAPYHAAGGDLIALGRGEGEGP